MTARAATMVLLAVAALCCPVTAHAWELNKGTNGVVISREAHDSSKTVDVYVYYDYKGGETDWVNAHTPTVTSSYDANKLYDKAIAANTGTTFEVALHPDHRLQLVYVREDQAPNTPLATFAVINEPVLIREVEPIESVSIEGSVVVSTMPSMSLDATSLAVHSDSEITVAPNEALSAFALIAAVALGLVVAKGWRP